MALVPFGNPTDGQQGLESEVRKLSISEKAGKPKTGSSKAKREKLAESWEDELSAGEDTETDIISPAAKTESLPDAPPPTPASATHSGSQREPYFAENSSSFGILNSSGSPRKPETRPEKTDAVARRMIAGALGVRAPKKTEEGREYEKAVRDRERKKRDQEREAQRRAEEDAQRARAAVWSD